MLGLLFFSSGFEVQSFPPKVTRLLSGGVRIRTQVFLIAGLPFYSLRKHRCLVEEGMMSR